MKEATVGLLCALHVACALPRYTVSENPIRETSPRRHGSGYLKKRLYDLADIPLARVGLVLPSGRAIMPHVDVEATLLAHLSVGSNTAMMWGIGDVPTFTAAEEVVSVLGYISQTNGEYRPASLLVTHDHRVLACETLRPENAEDGTMQGHACCLVPLLLTLRKDGTWGPPGPEHAPPPVRWADVDACAMLFPVALRFGVSPGEALDFLVGIIGLDVAGDDGLPWDERRWGERGEVLLSYVID